MKYAKLSAFFALAVVSLPFLVSAQDGVISQKGYPIGQAGELFFRAMNSVASDSPESAILKIQQITGADSATSSAFLARMAGAVNSIESASHELSASVCARRTEFRALPELAKALTQQDDDYESLRALVVRETESVLGKDGMRRFEAYLTAKHEKDTYSRNDYLALLPSRKYTVETFLARKCGAK